MGHVEDRWYRPKRDGAGGVVLNVRGKPVMEPTELYGKGLRYRVRYISPEGRERSKSFPDRQKKRADDFLIEVESDKREGKYIDPRAARTKFRQQAESWFKAQSPDLGTRGTLRSRLESRIYPTFGNLTLSRIGPSTVRDWVSQLDERKYADNYKAVLFGILSGVLDSAVDDHLIRENPCKAKTVRRPVAKSPKVTVWPDERVIAVRSGLEERYRVVVSIGRGLGLRQSEILALSPEEDIDRDGMVVLVQRQIKLVSRSNDDGNSQRVLTFALPKRGKTRYVPLSRAVLADIDSHLAAFPAQPVTLPWGEPDGVPTTARLLVSRPDGGAWSGDLFTKVPWMAAFRRSGLRYNGRPDGMHTALRHLYASKLLAAGVSPTDLAEYLGHDDPGFTLAVYTHLLPSSHDRARKAIDADFGWPAADDGLTAA